MSIIDWILSLLVIIGGTIGYYRGFIPQLGLIAGILLGILVCNIFGGWAENVLIALVPESAFWQMSEVRVSLMARFILFIFVYLSVELASVMMQSYLDRVRLGSSGRWMGILVGVFATIVASSIVINSLFMLSPRNSLLTEAHAADNVPFMMAMDFMPAVLGCGSMPSSMINISQPVEKQ